MLELFLCSLLTIFPDYLYRRYAQGKRIGKEITLFSVWFELRWGITACLMLTVSLITMIFYFHPSTDSAILFFRTVPILPETSGRVAEVNLDFSAPVAKGAVIFRLDSSKQEAALETARRKIAEVDAAMVAAQTDVTKTEAQIQQAKSDYEQALDELEVKSELQRRKIRALYRSVTSKNFRFSLMEGAALLMSPSRQSDPRSLGVDTAARGESQRTSGAGSGAGGV